MKNLYVVFVVILWLVCLAFPLIFARDWVSSHVWSFAISEFILTGFALAIILSLVAKNIFKDFDKFSGS